MKVTYKEFLTRYIDDDFLDKYYDKDNNKIDLNEVADAFTHIKLKDGREVRLSDIWKEIGFKPEYTLENVYPGIWNKWVDASISPENYFFMSKEMIPLRINGIKRHSYLGFKVNFLKHTWVGDTILDLDLKTTEEYLKFLNDKQIANRSNFHIDIYKIIWKFLKENERISYKDLLNFLDKEIEVTGTIMGSMNLVLEFAKAPIRFERDDFNLGENEVLTYEQFKKYVDTLDDYALQFTLVCLFHGMTHSKYEKEGIVGVKMSDIDKENKTIRFIHNSKEYILDIDDYFIEVAERCYEDKTYIEKRNRTSLDMVMYYNKGSEYVIKSRVNKNTDFGLDPIKRTLLDRKIGEIEYSHKDITHFGGIHRLRQIQLKSGFDRCSVKIYNYYKSKIAPIKAFNITEFMRKYNDLYSTTEGKSFNIMDVFN